MDDISRRVAAYLSAVEPKNRKKTYAIQDLETLYEMGNFNKFARDNGIDESSVKLLGQVKLGRQDIYTHQIFLLRRVIRPSRWFFMPGEELPAEVPYTPLHGDGDMFTHESLGIRELKKICFRNTVAGTLRHFDIEMWQYKNIMYKRKNKQGKKVYRSLPSTHIIRKTRTEINPDLWFIFPDEAEAASGRKKN